MPTITDTDTTPDIHSWELANNSFLRLFAAFFIILTIQSWMQAIGISATSPTGFDTMPNHWRFAIAALCVLHPMTALGLWGLFAWGIAVWLLAILVQVTMHLAFPDLYGPNNLLIIFHFICLAIFLILKIAIHITINKQ